MNYDMRQKLRRPVVMKCAHLVCKLVCRELPMENVLEQLHEDMADELWRTLNGFKNRPSLEILKVLYSCHAT
jgi:hypothetical protein